LINNHKAIQNIVDGAVAQIKISSLLRADGSNFRTWFRALEMAAEDFLEEKDFFVAPNVWRLLEPVARRILIRVVDESLADGLFTLTTVYAMVNSLRRRFTTFSKVLSL
jgi:hypothetical protein